MEPSYGQFAGQRNLTGVTPATGASSPVTSNGEAATLNRFVAAAPTAYGVHNEHARKALDSLSEKSGGIAKGTQVYRALSDHDLRAFKDMQVGDSHSLDAPKSFVKASELQELGKMTKSGLTGGGAMNAVASIEAMEDVPGVNRVNDFLRTPKGKVPGSKTDEVQGFDTEGFLNRGTRLRLEGHTPGADGSPDIYRFTAHRDVGPQFKESN